MNTRILEQLDPVTRSIVVTEILHPELGAGTSKCAHAIMAYFLLNPEHRHNLKEVEQILSLCLEVAQHSAQPTDNAAAGDDLITQGHR
jgi:hypothetical protein